MNVSNLTGRTFGRLVVIETIGKRGKRVFWRCQCSCGNMKDVASNHLKEGMVNSCGCIRKEKGAAFLRTYSKEHVSTKRGGYGDSNRNRLYLSYRRGAIRRGIEFSLTRENFAEITSKNCFYCGSEPMSIAKGKGTFGQYVYNGIDRIDGDIGYALSNCNPCCWMCNRAKLDSSLDDFNLWLERLTNYRIEKRLTER